MTVCSVKDAAAKRCWGYHILTVLAVLGMKLYYSRADSSALRWILAPTAWWVRLLSGTAFVYEPGVGYVNHAIRFIIAPSCSGVQFLMIVFAVLAVSFVHQMRTPLGRILWMTGSAAAAVLLTVFVNGFRIALSIWVPELVFRTEAGLSKGGLSGWLTPERLHTITGVAVYFTALLVIFGIADRAASHMTEGCPEKGAEGMTGGVRRHCGWTLPVLMYFLVVLALPLFHGAFAKNPGQFAEFAALVAAVCTVILCLVRGIAAVWNGRRV